MKAILFLLLFCILCCRAVSAEAAEPPISGDSMHINADRMNQSLSDGVYTAEGNVVVRWQEMNLVADQVRYDAAHHLLNATGSVVLTKGGSVLKGKTLVMNMDSGRAEVDSTVLTIPSTNMTVVSEKLVRMNENEFDVTTTELTACDMPDPSWKFGASTLKVNLLGYATGRDVIFYVKNTPVLYLPWVAFPVVLEKTSGLLFPRFGYSNSRGAQLDIPLYLVISPGQDIQMDLDIMSRRGIATGVNYRYIRERGSEGRISAYQVYDQLADRWRWQLGQEHKEIFSSSANLRMYADITSDRAFLNDFGDKTGEYNRKSNSTATDSGERIGEYNRQSSDASINLLKTWQNYAVTSYLRYSENLYAADNRGTVQAMPSLGIAGVRQSIFTLPLYFDLDGSGENLHRESIPSGQRLYLFPRLTLLPFQNSYLQTSLFAGAHIRGYTTDRRDIGSGVHASDGDLLPEAGVRVSTSLTRIYDSDFQLLKKIRHEIVPEIKYSFVPERNQQRLPFYDYTDRMIHQNMVSLSVTSLLNGKFVSEGAGEYRDISKIKLEARYSISGEQRDLLSLVQSGRPWSDLILESETWLTKLLRLTLDVRYNLYEKNLSTAATGMEFDDRQGNSIGAGYQMARNEVEYIEGRFKTNLIKPLNLTYITRYSFDRGDFLESVYAAEYRQKCWSVNLAFHQHPGNQSFTMNFNLAGL